MEDLVKRLNKHPLFRFLSSVRLAVPLLLVTAAVTAWATVLESRYGAQYAKMAVYNAAWFDLLLALLWINIFAAAVSRYPFRKRHTGFVITHIGLLVLLAGGFVTSRYGIDGQLRVVEGESSHSVFVQRLVIEVQGPDPDDRRIVRVGRGLSRLDLGDLKSVNDSLRAPLTVQEYLPFARMDERYVESPEGTAPAIGFLLRSPFFNVGEWLQGDERPEIQMGPAKLRLIRGDDALEQAAEKRNKAAAEPALVVLDGATDSVLKRVAVSVLKDKPLQIRGVKVALVRALRQASVVDNKLVEGGEAGKNPALELTIERQGSVAREVAYARHPDFSLSRDKSAGLKFRYETGAAGEGLSAMVEEEPETRAESVASSGGRDRSGNVIEFRIRDSDPGRVAVELYKDQVRVQAAAMSAGESLETPWMGMKLTIGSILRRSKRQSTVDIAPLVDRQALAPAAVRISPFGAALGEAFWLVEGQEQVFTRGDKRYRVYFGPEILELPFSIKLEKFSKLDYPGTGTAMSFESEVTVGDSGPRTRISMNNPLKRDGYTLYQSSYEMERGRTPASIFSVNLDPGRPIKYAGSAILAIGIIVFTLMRSRFYQGKKNERAV